MRTLHRFSFLLLFFIASQHLTAQNCDPWITKAYKELYNRTPAADECNIRNYNNGSWNNYSELVNYIKNYNNSKTMSASQNCDPWITKAYKELYNRTPTADDCNIRNYNNGSWNNYSELVSYIKNYNSSKMASAAQGCDPWITKAYKELYNRAPTAQECNIRNYNNGSWSNYSELLGYVKNFNTKTSPAKKAELKGDPWIFQAYKELFNRQPCAWELNVKNYNDGSWKNYAELKKYVKEFRASMDKLGIALKTTDAKNNNSYVIFEKDGKVLGIDLVSNDGGNVVAAGGMNVISAGGDNVIAPGGANVIAPGGGNVIAPGGGNVIAPGGANVIAPGGANFRITNDMAGVSFGNKYTIQSAGTTVIASSGKGALIFR